MNDMFCKHTFSVSNPPLLNFLHYQNSCSIPYWLWIVTFIISSQVSCATNAAYQGLIKSLSLMLRRRRPLRCHKFQIILIEKRTLHFKDHDFMHWKGMKGSIRNSCIKLESKCLDFYFIKSLRFFSYKTVTLVRCWIFHLWYLKM